MFKLDSPARLLTAALIAWVIIMVAAAIVVASCPPSKPAVETLAVTTPCMVEGEAGTVVRTTFVNMQNGSDKYGENQVTFKMSNNSGIRVCSWPLLGDGTLKVGDVVVAALGGNRVL